MHEAHREAAEQHELAARGHRTAAEHNERGDNETGNWHAERALEYADHAFRLAKQAHSTSGKIVTLSMSARYNKGPLCEDHLRAAELHDGAAHAHRAAEEHGQANHLSGNEHSRLALEQSQYAYEHTDAITGGNGIATFGDDDISALAHELWQARGRPEGSSEEDWFHAAKELRTRADAAKRPVWSTAGEDRTGHALSGFSS